MARTPELTLLDVLWRARWTILATCLLLGLSAGALSSQQPRRFEASARLLLSDPRAVALGQPAAPVDPTRDLARQAEIARSATVLDAAAQRLGPPVTGGSLAPRIVVTPATDVDLLAITASGRTREDAAEAANAVADAFRERREERARAAADASITELERQLDDLDRPCGELHTRLAAAPQDEAARSEREAIAARRVAVQDQLQDIRTDVALFGDGIELFQPAQVPIEPVAPSPLRDAALASVLGLLGASTGAWLLAERRDRQRRVPGGPDEQLEGLVLGDVPDLIGERDPNDLPTVSSPTSPGAEAFQFLVATLGHVLERRGGDTLTIAGVGAGDDSSAVALNLAVAAAQDGRRVVLVDGDQRDRRLTRRASLEEFPGLAELVDDDTNLDGCLAPVRIDEHVTFWLVGAGGAVASPAAFFRTTGFRKALTRLRERADLIVVGSPPILTVSDGASAAAQTDGLILVTRAGTTAQDLARARDTLARAGGDLLGVVRTTAAEALAPR